MLKVDADPKGLSPQDFVKLQLEKGLIKER